MYKCEIIKDSICDTRLTTFVITYPRIIHAEMMTHRVFSRNAASSRAIPVDKMIKMVEEDPFIPTYWGKNQKGMQANEEISNDQIDNCETLWIGCLNKSLDVAKTLSKELHVHKQLVNRLLEPFSWITVIITATEFENFFALRCHKDAQPEIQVIAKMMRDEYENSIPKKLNKYEWHLPFIRDKEDLSLEDSIKISVARCARVSYLNHFGQKDLEDDKRLYNQLVESKHMSPLEHCAVPSKICIHCGDTHTCSSFWSNFNKWQSYRYYLEAGINIFE